MKAWMRLINFSIAKVNLLTINLLQNHGHHRPWFFCPEELTGQRASLIHEDSFVLDIPKIA